MVGLADTCLVTTSEFSHRNAAFSGFRRVHIMFHPFMFHRAAPYMPTPLIFVSLTFVSRPPRASQHTPRRGTDYCESCVLYCVSMIVQLQVQLRTLDRY